VSALTTEEAVAAHREHRRLTTVPDERLSAAGVAAELEAVTEARERAKELREAISPKRIAQLEKRQHELAAVEARRKHVAAEALTAATPKLEALYADALAALEAYLDAAEAVQAFRAEYDETFRSARAAGVEPLPMRIEPFTVRAHRDRALADLFARAQQIRFTW
jgi:DNA repair ATPase RecN